MSRKAADRGEEEEEEEKKKKEEGKGRDQGGCEEGQRHKGTKA